MARIARALNEAAIPCPSAADPARNPHRPGTGWTLGTVATILQNPRYTGRQVWNRQRTDKDLADPGDVSLGHKSVQRWNLPDGWVISKKPAHPTLVSEIARQRDLPGRSKMGRENSPGGSARTSTRLPDPAAKPAPARGLTRSATSRLLSRVDRYASRPPEAVFVVTAA